MSAIHETCPTCPIAADLAFITQTAPSTHCQPFSCNWSQQQISREAGSWKHACVISNLTIISSVSLKNKRKLKKMKKLQVHNVWKGMSLCHHASSFALSYFGVSFQKGFFSKSCYQKVWSLYTYFKNGATLCKTWTECDDMLIHFKIHKDYTLNVNHWFVNICLFRGWWQQRLSNELGLELRNAHKTPVWNVPDVNSEFIRLRFGGTSYKYSIPHGLGNTKPLSVCLPIIVFCFY